MNAPNQLAVMGFVHSSLGVDTFKNRYSDFGNPSHLFVEQPDLPAGRAAGYIKQTIEQNGVLRDAGIEFCDTRVYSIDGTLSSNFPLGDSVLAEKFEASGCAIKRACTRMVDGDGIVTFEQVRLIRARKVYDQINQLRERAMIDQVAAVCESDNVTNGLVIVGASHLDAVALGLQAEKINATPPELFPLLNFASNCNRTGADYGISARAFVASTVTLHAGMHQLGQGREMPTGITNLGSEGEAFGEELFHALRATAEARIRASRGSRTSPSQAIIELAVGLAA